MPHTDALLRALLQVLTNSPRAEAVARTLALGTLRGLQPLSVTVHAIVGDALELRSHFGVSPDRARLALRIPADAPAPECDVARSARTCRIPGDDLAGAFPLMAHHDTGFPGELLCLPLMHEARAIGVLAIRLPKATPQDLATRDLLDGTCAALALWLLADARTAPAPPGGARLRITERQQRVLDGLRRGLKNGAIADELGFAIGTIKADITAMSALLGATGREDLLRKAERAGF